MTRTILATVGLAAFVTLVPSGSAILQLAPVSGFGTGVYDENPGCADMAARMDLDIDPDSGNGWVLVAQNCPQFLGTPFPCLFLTCMWSDTFDDCVEVLTPNGQAFECGDPGMIGASIADGHYLYLEVATGTVRYFHQADGVLRTFAGTLTLV